MEIPPLAVNREIVLGVPRVVRDSQRPVVLGLRAGSPVMEVRMESFRE